MSNTQNPLGIDKDKVSALGAQLHQLCVGKEVSVGLTALTAAFYAVLTECPGAAPIGIHLLQKSLDLIEKQIVPSQQHPH